MEKNGSSDTGGGISADVRYSIPSPNEVRKASPPSFAATGWGSQSPK